MTKDTAALDLDDRQRRHLEALVLKADRVLTVSKAGLVDSGAMSAAEEAMAALAEFGLMALESGSYVCGR
jgi:hypothetical protein